MPLILRHWHCSRTVPWPVRHGGSRPDAPVSFVPFRLRRVSSWLSPYVSIYSASFVSLTVNGARVALNDIHGHGFIVEDKLFPFSISSPSVPVPVAHPAQSAPSHPHRTTHYVITRFFLVLFLLSVYLFAVSCICNVEHCTSSVINAWLPLMWRPKGRGLQWLWMGITWNKWLSSFPANVDAAENGFSNEEVTCQMRTTTSLTFPRPEPPLCEGLSPLRHHDGIVHAGAVVSPSAPLYGNTNPGRPAIGSVSSV